MKKEKQYLAKFIREGNSPFTDRINFYKKDGVIYRDSVINAVVMMDVIVPKVPGMIKGYYSIGLKE